ncbi:helix-turn-helix domain-containing protein [Planctomycetota bacterium]
MDSTVPIEELLYEEEGATLDFKREQYAFSTVSDHQKSELLKDILAFTNAWRRQDAFILIGVEEVKGGRSKPLGINIELDDAQLQQFVNSKTQRPIDFSYSTILIDEVKVGVIRIPVQTRPFYLKRDYGKLSKHVVYIRRGSSTGEASPEEIRDMGRSETKNALEIPDLTFEFADLRTRSKCGAKLELNTVLLDIPPIENIPDYREERNIGALGMPICSLNHARADYYRDLVQYYYVSKKSSELAFLLRNDSAKVISDIRVEVMVKKQGDRFVIFESNAFPDFPESHFDIAANITPLAEQIAERNKKLIEVQELDDCYRVEVPFEKAQPKQTVFSNDKAYIAVNENISIQCEVTIYADNIPVPIEQKLEIFCDVTRAEGSLEHIEEMHYQYLLTKGFKRPR